MTAAALTPSLAERSAREAAPPGSPPLHEPQRFVASDGYELGYRLLQPRGVARGLVVALHGIQSHSGWYGYSSAALAKAGYVVAFLDRRGSGVNAFDRGDAPHSDRLIADVVQFVGHLDRITDANLPRALTAISWGGKLAAAVAIRRPELFRGLALITPGICARIQANWLQRAAVRCASATKAARREVPIPLDDPALFTSSPEYQRFIESDRLTLRRVTVRFLTASLALDRFVRKNALAIRCPALLMLAGRDLIVDNDRTRQFFVTLGSSVKTLMEYESACHTLEFEPDRHEFVADLIRWLDQTLCPERPSVFAFEPLTGERL